MKTFVIAGAIALAVGATAVARPAPSEAEYLHASRCRGLAAGFGIVDPGFGAVLRASQGDRAAGLQERAAAEFARARREAAGSDGHDRAAGDQIGGCKVFLTSGESNALR